MATASSSLSSSAATTSKFSSSSLSAATSSSSRLSSSNSSSSSASQTPVATLYFVHNDHLGTPQVVTDKNQLVVFMADYQPFGKLQPNQTNSIELYSRFPGQYLDGETGLYYNYFRDYDPSIGGYIESDPIGLDGGINTYGYVLQNPINYSDPTGQVAGAAVSGATALMVGALVCSASHCLDKSAKAMTDVADRLWDEARGSGKERATDVPSWARGKSPNPNESCDDYASRILKDQYGCDDPRANKRGPGSEHSKIKKYCERGGR